jgi:hypothetical protein
MKMRKTPNPERPTPNIDFGRLSVSEAPNGNYATRPKYDLEERLLEFTANFVSQGSELSAALTEVEELIRISAASVRTTEKNAK